MAKFFGTGRKNTGRTDKYSDETPAKDYADYRKDNPNDKKEARKIAKEISDGIRKPEHLGKKSFAVKKQELTSHIQNYQETFNSVEKNKWEARLSELVEALKEQ